MTDIYDGAEWTEMDIEDLKAANRARPLERKPRVPCPLIGEDRK
jgi:hypothetical protein